MGLLNKNDDLRMSGRNGECKIAFIEPPNDNKIYYGILINDALYRAWDVDSFSDEAVELIEVLMEAFDKGYTIRAQNPTNIGNERKMIPMPLTISESLKSKVSNYTPVKPVSVDVEEKSTVSASPSPIFETEPQVPSMPEIKTKPDTILPGIETIPAAPTTTGITGFPPLPDVKPLSSLHPVSATPVVSETKTDPEPVRTEEETAAAESAASKPAMEIIAEPVEKPYGVCMNGHVTYRKIAFCPECGTKITAQAYSDIPMLEEDNDSLNEDANGFLASYMSNFNR